MKRIVLMVATLVAALTLSTGTASADGHASDVYVLHGIPGLTVDVYVNGDHTLEGFEPEAVAGPLALEPGDYDIEIYAAGADAAADDPALALTATVPDGGLSISIIAHLDADAAPTATIFVNDNSAIAEGNGRVTVRHTAAAPEVDIVAGGAAVDGLTGLSNPNEASIELPAGDYPTGIAAAGTTEALVDAPLTIADGTHLVVYAVGDLAGGTFTLLTQSFDGLSAAADTAPAVVNAGNSGLAADSSSSNMALILVIAAAVAFAVSVPAVRLARKER